jgi:hypothetical protein
LAAGCDLHHPRRTNRADFDIDTGLDTDQYPRALYAPRPILSGMITRRGLVRAAVLVNLLDVAILVGSEGSASSTCCWCGAR